MNQCLVVRHLAVQEHIRPERHFLRIVHGQVLARRVRQRHVGRGDTVVEKERVVTVGGQIGEDFFVFVIHAETVHQLWGAAVFNEVLAGVPVIDPGVQRVVETHQFGGCMNVPFADQRCIVTGSLELFGDGWVGQVDSFVKRPRGHDWPAVFVRRRGVTERAHTGTRELA